MRRLVRLRSAGGTITRYVLSAQGEVLQTWIGTDDSGASDSVPDGSGGANNMRQVEIDHYDNGSDKGDRNLTKVVRFVNSSTKRVTTYGYDFRNRQVSTDGEVSFYESQAYDNQDRVVRVDQRDTNGSGKLIARNETKYDRQGRVYQSLIYGVDPNTGTVGNVMTGKIWYDGVGNMTKLQAAGSNAFTKSFYDGVRRLIKQYTAYFISAPVAGDIVLQQMEATYDDASNVIEQLMRERFHDAPSTAVGELTSPGGADPKARVSYQASWPDPLGRQVAMADYGTYGGAELVRPDTIPARSDTVLLTTVSYNSSGDAELVTDPAGTVTKSVFDNAGRLITQIEDYSASPGHLNRKTDYAYNADGRLNKLTARNSTTGDQVTTYGYGTTTSVSNIASNDLLAWISYPDSTAPNDRMTFHYNRQGQIKWRKDQLGTVHELEYDLLGRQIHDRVTTLGSGVDGTIRRISTSYEVRGMVQNVTSYNNAIVGSGTVINDVQHTYNNFAQLTAQYQSHSGAVNTATTPKVQYGYADGSANTVRPTSITYPNGRVITLDYGTAGEMNDQLSRIGALIDSSGSTHLADYTYLGLNRIVQVLSPQPNIKLTYIMQSGESPGDGGDQYTGWDRFSRVIDQRWINGSGTALERVQYGFDRASNRLYRANMVASGGQDEYYTYDTLYQLLNLDRGTLNSSRTGIAGTPAREEDFTFDPTGNWSQYVTKVSGLTTLNQGRTHNKVNEITAINGSSAYIAEDAAGNCIRVPRTDNWLASLDLAYDAWNRLVSVSANPVPSSSSSGQGSHGSAGAGSLGGSLATSTSSASPTPVAGYQYDGLNRRTLKTTTVARHYFYTSAWQIIEERRGTSTTADRQFVWGLRYLDDLVLRDHVTDRFYALHDVFNCTATATTIGTIFERYGYGAYGQPRFMDAGFNNKSSSNIEWDTLFGDYRRDSETGMYQVRYRCLHPTLGRWSVRDPLQYFDVLNLYTYCLNDGINGVDPLGLTPGTNAMDPSGIVSNTNASAASLNSSTNGVPTGGAVPSLVSQLLESIAVIKAIIDDLLSCDCGDLTINGKVTLSKITTSRLPGCSGACCPAFQWEYRLFLQAIINSQFPYKQKKACAKGSSCTITGNGKLSSTLSGDLAVSMSAFLEWPPKHPLTCKVSFHLEGKVDGDYHLGHCQKN